jgi:hypothetical protein
VYTDGETVSIATLIAKELVPAAMKRAGAKIVRTGTLSKKLSLGEGVSVSESVATLFQ